MQDLVARGESGFLEMLKNVTGTVAFDKKLEKMQGALEEARVKKSALQAILTEIEAKLEGLSIDKEAYKDI